MIHRDRRLGHMASHCRWWLLVLLISLLRLENSSATRLDKPPQIVKDLNQRMVLKLGPLNRFVLECRGDADPAPTYRWYKNNQVLTKELLAEQEVEEISDNEHTQLHFSSPSEEHEGYYHCEAENSVGRARSSVTHVAPAFPPPSPGTTKPHFVEAPKTELQSLGSRVELVCKASGSPPPDITWTKNGNILKTNTETLVIPSLGKDDVANYACNASNIAGYEYKNVILNILTMTPRIKEGPAKQHVGSKGSNITLKCEAEGYPAPVITWTRENKPVTDSDKFQVDSSTGDLTVTHASTEDDGRYECRAKSINGEDTAAGQLIVKTITTIIDGPVDMTVTMEDTVVMKCVVVADLSLEMDVTWKKDNLDFEESERIQRNDDHSLTIRNLTFDDSGLYTCVARTSLSTASETGQLTVVGVGPLLVPVSGEEMLLEGENFRIPCTLTQGVPAPSVIWYQDGEEVDRSRVLVEEDNTLVLGPVTSDDMGSYICKAQNSEGEDSITVSVRVSGSTKVLSPPRDVDLQAQAGVDVFFPCEVSVDSLLADSYNVEWYKDREELELYRLTGLDLVVPGEDNVLPYEELSEPCEDTDYRHYLLSNNTLVVCGLQPTDVGYYHCEVSTQLEESIKSSYSSIYIGQKFPWWIIALVITVTLLLLLLLCVVCWWRRKKQGKGYYGMNVEDGAINNKSDIYYTTEDNESIMDEIDQSMLEKQNGKTPIFTPRTIRRLARVDKSIGSIGSLLDDDEYLDKGYDEDGSFRERYAE